MTLLAFAFPLSAQPVLKVVNGTVKEISMERNEIVVSSLHPATGTREELSFKVDAATGFSGGFHLEDLRPNEPVSVDYEEDPEGRRAVLIKRVPLRGVPTGHSPS